MVKKHHLQQPRQLQVLKVGDWSVRKLPDNPEIAFALLAKFEPGTGDCLGFFEAQKCVERVERDVELPWSSYKVGPQFVS